MKINKKRIVTSHPVQFDPVASHNMADFGKIIAYRDVVSSFAVCIFSSPKQDLRGPTELQNFLQANLLQLVFSERRRIDINKFQYSYIYIFNAYSYGNNPELAGEVEIRAFKRVNENKRGSAHWRLNRIVLGTETIYVAPGP